MIKTQQKKDGTVKVTFAVPTEVGPTSVVGDFNDWDPEAHPMQKRSNNTRSVAVELEPDSEYRFRYLVDGGDWRNEPDVEQVGNDHGGEDSLLRL